MSFQLSSQKRLLSSFNPLVMVMAVLIAIVVKTAGWPILSESFRHWDVLLPFIVYFGQRRSLTEGLILSLFCSHLYSLASGAPIGVFTTHYLILFAVVRGLNYAISADTWISIVSLLLGLSLLARFIITWVAAGFGHGWPLFSWANISFGGMFLNAVTGYFLYAWARLLDRWTYKSLAPEIELDGSNL